MEKGRSTTGPQPSEPNNEKKSDPEIEYQKYLEGERRKKANEKRRRFIDLVGGMGAFERFTFERFKPEWAPQAYDTALHFCPDVDNLYFWGPSRVGKTHLSDAIARRSFDKGRVVHIASIPGFKDDLRLLESQYDYLGKQKLITRLITAEVLVLHELGRGTVTEHIQETLWTILEGRILAGRNGLVVTSNFSPQDIGVKYGGTISERIRELCGTVGIIEFPMRKSEGR